MVTMLDVKIGDEITFPIARSGRNLTLTVKGFYEDPFMGSSMIGMKGFLISEADRAAALAILQNAFCGLLIAFAAVLLIVAAAVIGHSISGTISAETVNMGILKTVGFDSRGLRTVQLFMYLFPIVIGFAAGIILSVPLGTFTANATITTTGIKIPAALPYGLTAIFFAIIIVLLGAFIVLRTRKIAKISPMSAIRGKTEKTRFSPEKTPCAFGKAMDFRLALRPRCCWRFSPRLSGE